MVKTPPSNVNTNTINKTTTAGTPYFDHNGITNNGNNQNTMTYGHDHSTNQRPLDTPSYDVNNNGNTTTMTLNHHTTTAMGTIGGATHTHTHAQTPTQGQQAQEIHIVTTPQYTAYSHQVPMQITHTTDGGTTGNNTGSIEEIAVLDIGGGFQIGNLEDSSSSNHTESASTTSTHSSSEFDPEHPQHGLSAQDEFSDNDGIIYTHHHNQQPKHHNNNNNNNHVNAHSNVSIDNILSANMHSQFSA
eukprot:CAMPEP_0201595298 /NCGR_PEP_ID=MMETSP0190_2-20130828/192347_1 /ASSEMBLY_ACC=CAM_ASM_000263 /TAXON_ID=37353 /ORGANISM="Rosalina sp." /LENGTH=244 /DNA_ID=CAMNT_0048055235 /DNA_START=849 /DNA_END=1580 /DNA_ORIENTATION=+